MDIIRRLTIIAGLILISFACAQAQDGIIASSYKPGAVFYGDSVVFNFNATAQNISGTVDVSGSPSGGTISKTDTTSNISISSIGAPPWVAYGGGSSSNVNGAVNDDGGGFWISNQLVKSGWYTEMLNQDSEFLRISGLSKTSTYSIEILSSISSVIGAPTDDTCGYALTGSSTTAYTFVYQVNNTSKTVLFTGITPNSNGYIYIRFKAKSTTEPNSNMYNIVSGIKIKKN